VSSAGLTRGAVAAADRALSATRALARVAGRPFTGVIGAWRRSLHLRVVSATVVLCVVVLIVIAQFLLSRVTEGLLEAKQRSALDEAHSGQTDAEDYISSAQKASDSSDQVSAKQLLDGIVTLLESRAGNPPLYEVVITTSDVGVVPDFGTNAVDEASVPAALRQAIVRSNSESSTYTRLRYTNAARSVPAFVVGLPLSPPVAGNSYELYYLFPLSQEQDTLAIVERTLAAAGIALLLLVGGIAWIVTRQVVTPVRIAARTAERFSAGRLEERMMVRGEDDLAKLAGSFNQMASSLQRQISQLEDLSRIQRRFVSDVSHELRTPLTTVRMAADVLHEARTGFDPATARSAELLQAQLDRFEELLSDLLEISRFDAGAAVLEAEPTDLVEAARRVLDATEPLADRKGCRVRLEAPQTRVIAEVDGRRVARILRNLVVNAVEHGEGRPVVVTLMGDDEAVAVTVRDHGVGLRPGESTLVFNRFWRADPARARSTGGTGLGLAIALEDAHLHGGWLQAWGEPGDGCNFRLTLPRKALAVITTSPLPLPPGDARQGRVVPLVAAARMPWNADA
jgi:two-component system, OmpR family, sensor histidine kinase MtrB